MSHGRVLEHVLVEQRRKRLRRVELALKELAHLAKVRVEAIKAERHERLEKLHRSETERHTINIATQQGSHIGPVFGEQPCTSCISRPRSPPRASWPVSLRWSAWNY